MNDAFRQLLADGDVAGLRRAWAELAPHLPQPASDEAATVAMHYARTQVERLELAARAWSHRWLSERGLPSALPDHLKPAAERLYPVTVEAVGIAVGCVNPALKPAAALIERAMADAVEDCFANGVRDRARVARQMAAARDRTQHQLFGAIRAPRH